GDYSSAIMVKLVSTSARARIHYTLDGSAPGPGQPGSRLYVEDTVGFRLDTTATLRALAVAGEGATFRKGREFTAKYTFIDAGTRTLGPGQQVEISPRYSISNPLVGAPRVLVQVIKADSLRPLRGFRDVRFGLNISLPPSSGAYSQVILASPAGEECSLYSLSQAGVIRFVSSADTVPLPSTGTYFLGVDTMPPKVVWAGESFHGDSTRILFNLEDNVSGFAWDVERSHGSPLRGQALDDQHILVLTLKAPEGPLAPLWVRLKVDDRRNQVRFPAAPAAVYPLSQRHSQPVRGPAVLKVGTSAERPWDMVSVPLDISGGFTWARLKRENGGQAIAAKVMDPSTGKYRDMRDGDALRPGSAAWLASDAALSSLALGALQTVGRQGKEAVTVGLKPGWNQISNPTQSPLLWPFSRGTPGYETSLVKALHGYDPALPGTGYFDTDTLIPWKGYFVFHKGKADTVIVLRNAAPGAKRSAENRSQGVRFRVRVDRLPALRLGAQPFAGDGLGVEDEIQPPAPSAGPERGPRLWSDRQRLRLGTDILGFRPGEVLAWRVVATGSIQDTSPSGGARVEGLELPEGYAAWAVSRARGLRFALREDAHIPLSPDAADSLDVYAGPAALLEARLAGLPERVEEFHARITARPDGYALDLALPFAARVRWSLWSLDGKRLDADTKVLPSGRYALARGGRAHAFRGACVLRLDWTSVGADGDIRRRGKVNRAVVLP
ncbi:MAG TPA: chitobiase/beta-hexosaminidase C-terminal domain-containing protein, partial [Fibrobacteria bacterium]|nr:chitobiase/beta-hexosaminidase C-terminal domain-containing protein [Fibrobacteria bacterium]